MVLGRTLLGSVRHTPLPLLRTALHTWAPGVWITTLPCTEHASLLCILADTQCQFDRIVMLWPCLAAGRSALPVRMASTAGVDLYPHGLKPVTGGRALQQEI